MSNLLFQKMRLTNWPFSERAVEDEIAGLLDVFPITVKSDWRIARAVWHYQLGGAALGRELAMTEVRWQQPKD